MGAWRDFGAWMMPRAVDVEPFLSRTLGDTGVLRGGAHDFWLVGAIALAFPLVRVLVDHRVYAPLARWVLGVPGGDPKKTDARVSREQVENVNKFRESAFKCGVQVLFTTVLLLVGLNKPWFYNTRLYWDDCATWPCDTPSSYGERFAYCLMLAYYVQAVPMLFLWETRRKDRWENLAHHVATIVLIAYSYYLNLTRVGIMVLVCHESNDIFLEAAKMARYAKHESATTAIFVAFMLSWFTTRVFMFPAFVIHSTLFESMARAREVGVVDIIRPHHAILNAFLLFLYCLHVYWSYLILRIAIKQLTTGGAEDIREVDSPKKQHAHKRSVGSMPSPA